MSHSINYYPWMTQTNTATTIVAPGAAWTTCTGVTIPTTTTGNTISIGGNSVAAGTIRTINMDRFGPPSYSDLTEELRPGTEWFTKGTVLRLKHSLFVWQKDEHATLCLSSDCILVYMGVVEDLEIGKERHWFMTESGSMVQYCYWVYDLSWRGNIKRSFEVVEECA